MWGWERADSGKPDEDPTEKEDTSVSKVQPTERQMHRFQVPGKKELTAELTKGVCGRVAKTQVGVSGLSFHVDQNEFLVWTWKAKGCLKKLALVSLREQIIHPGHYSPIARHSRERCMYETKRLRFFWPHMANEDYQTVRNLATCAHNCKSLNLQETCSYS